MFLPQDFGQFYTEAKHAKLHTRIITSPVYAKALSETCAKRLSDTNRPSGPSGADDDECIEVGGRTSGSSGEDRRNVPGKAPAPATTPGCREMDGPCRGWWLRGVEGPWRVVNVGICRAAEAADGEAEAAH